MCVGYGRKRARGGGGGGVNVSHTDGALKYTTPVLINKVISTHRC